MVQLRGTYLDLMSRKKLLDDQWCTVKEAAARMGISRSRVIRLITRGALMGRDVSMPTSSKPRWMLPVVSVECLMQTGIPVSGRWSRHRRR